MNGLPTYQALTGTGLLDEHKDSSSIVWSGLVNGLIANLTLPVHMDGKPTNRAQQSKSEPGLRVTAVKLETCARFSLSLLCVCQF